MTKKEIEKEIRQLKLEKYKAEYEDKRLKFVKVDKDDDLWTTFYN